MPRALTQSAVGWALVMGLSAVSGTAHGADLATKAPPPPGCVQAVDGLNGKIDGFGGSFADKSYFGGGGSLSAPLGCEFGAQVDLSGGSFDGRFIGTVSGHLFWRNPAQGLLGAYGDFTDWDQFGGVHAGHFGPEAEIYNGRWTAEGVAGVEFGNTKSGTVGSIIQTYSVPTRFFDQVNLAYYPQDNLEVYVGHRYLGGKNAAAFGGEWGIPMNNGMMAAPFVEARLGENSYHGVWGGVRLYFGAKDKTLIRRHREDDPNTWNDGPDSTSNGGSTTTVPTSGGSPCLCTFTLIPLIVLVRDWNHGSDVLTALSGLLAMTTDKVLLVCLLLCGIGLLFGTRRDRMSPRGRRAKPEAAAAAA